MRSAFFISVNIERDENSWSTYIHLEYLLRVWITVVTSTLGKEPWLVFLISSSMIKCQT